MAAEMQTLQRILVASDFSDQAGVAIDRAVELAREHEAELSIDSPLSWKKQRPSWSPASSSDSSH